NSAARSLVMLGQNLNFDNFVDNCPKSWSLFADIGPTPHQLAEYMQRHDTSRTIYAQFENYFSPILESIKESIDQNLPSIALLIRSTLSMHYVSIIGYNDFSKKIAVMDTTKIIYWITYDELKH